MTWGKDDHKVPPPIEEIERKRGHKKTKSPTECIVKTNRPGNCGICGSDNLVRERVKYCKICGCEEFAIISGERFFWLDRNKNRMCQCTEMFKLRRGKVVTLLVPHDVTGVESCSDCGAVKGPLCPNCKKPAWYKFELYPVQSKIHCHKCGYINAT